MVDSFQCLFLIVPAYDQLPNKPVYSVFLVSSINIFYFSSVQYLFPVQNCQKWTRLILFATHDRSVKLSKEITSDCKSTFFLVTTSYQSVLESAELPLRNCSKKCHHGSHDFANLSLLMIFH